MFFFVYFWSFGVVFFEEVEGMFYYLVVDIVDGGYGVVVVV